LVAVALVSTAAMAAPIAEMKVSGAEVQFRAAVEHAGAVLTVSTPGGAVLRFESAAGAVPSFGLFDAEGQFRPDGVYKWELRLAPVVSADTALRLRTARQRGDRAAAAEQARAGLDRELVQSGTFAISGGSFVYGDEAERPVRNATADSARNVTAPDQVIPDDLIVQGSGCFGFDCVNNESFGFDTIRLKENNLRIKAEDTSVGTFPSNDWQLTFNDSASGGANKFSVEDITGSRVPFTIEGGATTNSVFVDSTGRVGFRTSTPVLDLHVNTSNTPGIRLEQNNSGGFTAQTWDVAGNEANFFVRDVTGGSLLSFRIRPGAPTSSLDISADGDVGVGTGSPDQKMHVFQNADVNTIHLVENDNTGTSAAAVFRAQNDAGAQTNFIVHGSGRTLSRFGVTLGNRSEVLATTGNGLILGTLEADDLIIGTNNTNRILVGGSGGVTVTGNFTVSGGVKNFAVVDPADERRAIYYAALEGPEAGTYHRGTAKTVDGEAVIELPGHFSRVTERDRMTVQLTPNGGWGQLYVVSKTPERLVVRVAPGTSDLEFDYLVQGVRAGYLDFQVERENNLPR
jgi:hypothetical protein